MGEKPFASSLSPVVLMFPFTPHTAAKNMLCGSNQFIPTGKYSCAVAVEVRGSTTFMNLGSCQWELM